MSDDAGITCVVAGTGSIGSRHLRLLATRDDVRALALPVRAERARALQAEGFDVVAGWEEARAHGATHAVIATDTSRHAADAGAALKAGCHVLVEKPMAPDAAAARELAAAAQRAGKRLSVGCCLRFQRALGRVRERLADIGPVHAVRVECQSYLPDWRPDRAYRDSYSARTAEGGVLRDLIHEIDYTGWLFGWPAAVQGRIGNRGALGIESEEEADLFWRAESGAVVSMRLDYLTRPARRTMIIDGALGTLEWNGVTGVVSLAPAQGAAAVEALSDDPDDKYAAQLSAFFGTREHDDRLATADDGVRALAICDAVRRSAASRREEAVAC